MLSINAFFLLQIFSELAPAVATVYRAGIEMREIMEEAEHVL